MRVTTNATVLPYGGTGRLTKIGVETCLYWKTLEVLTLEAIGNSQTMTHDGFSAITLTTLTDS